MQGRNLAFPRKIVVRDRIGLSADAERHFRQDEPDDFHGLGLPGRTGRKRLPLFRPGVIGGSDFVVRNGRLFQRLFP